jgi:hypothetical protein
MTPDSAARLTTTLARIDMLNRADPRHVQVDGVDQPFEVVYAARVTAWVEQLVPAPSEVLRIAARGQHVQRWQLPRSKFPKTRVGYLQWREQLKGQHAQTVGRLMCEAGYAQELIDRAQQIMRKADLNDPETQTLEDALCLVFLETQCADMQRTASEEKMHHVVRQVWAKMSAQARSYLETLACSEEQRAWLRNVVS